MEDLERAISFIRKFGICQTIFFPIISKNKNRLFAGCEAVIKIPKIVKINSFSSMSEYVYRNPIIILYSSPKNNYLENVYKITNKNKTAEFKVGTIVFAKAFIIFGYDNIFNYYEMSFFKSGIFVDGGVGRSVGSYMVWKKDSNKYFDSIVGYCMIK